MSFKSTLFAFMSMSLLPTHSSAEIYEYRLSSLIGSTAATGAVIGTGGLSASQTGFAAAGFYLFPHATSGAMMIGSTAVGTSGAGTAGILAGTGAGLGAAAAIVTSPFVTVPAALAAIAGLGLEARCYFRDERITDTAMVLILLESIVENSSQSQIGLFTLSNEVWLRMGDEAGNQRVFLVRNLYVVNGELLHRDWFANTSLGYVAVLVSEEVAD